MQSAYFCVIIHVTQLPLLMTSHASSSATINKIYLILLRRSKAFQWRKNRFEILQHIKNSGEGFYVPSPPPSCICVHVWGLSGSFEIWQGSGWFCMWLHFFIKASFIIDTKGLYCVTKGNISFSSLLFCFRSAAFLLWVLLLIAIFLSKLCGQPLSINRFLKSEILPQRSLFVGFSTLHVCQIHFNNWWMIRSVNVYTGRFHLKCVFASMIAFSHFSWNVVPWYSTVSNKIVSVSDISAVSFIVGWCVSLLVPWIWRNLWRLVYFCPTRKKCHLCRDVAFSNSWFEDGSA